MVRALAALVSSFVLAAPAFASVDGSSCTPTDPYLPGGTTTMCWTCTSAGPTTPEPECLDRIALGYPNGWSVACGTQDGTDSAGNPVDFGCSASGQTVTFTDADGGSGEICPPQSWTFCVDVTAPDTATAPTCAFYTISGDGAGAEPHDIIDCGTCLPAEATVTIVKQTEPQDAGGQLFDFSGDLGGFALMGGESTTVTGLGPGSYSVSEAVPADWELTEITCDDPDGGTTVDVGTGTATLDVDAGEDITCTFLNTRLVTTGTVTIAKSTVPQDAGGQLFDFSGDLGAFSLSSGDSTTFADLEAGSYSVSEAVPADWELTEITCDDPDDGTTVDLEADTATLDVDPGESIVCTFRNTEIAVGASVTIVKDTDPEDAGGQLFGFAGDLGAFSLTGGDSTTFADVEPGSYTVSESLPPGWELTDIVCEDPDGGTTVDLGSSAVSLDVDADEDIVCTFLNTATAAPGSVTIVKETRPSNASGQIFDFAGDLGAFSLTGGESTTVEALEAGSYEVTESVPEGWSLTEIVCSDPDGGTTVDPQGATATIDVDPGESVTCTFVNTALGSVTVGLETDPADAGGQQFGFVGDLGDFTLTSGESTTASAILPGTYDVTESLPPGWELTSITCDDPDGGTTVDTATATAQLDVDPGEAISCTFLNTAVVTAGSITIVKQTVPADAGGQQFSFTGDLGPFALTGGESTTVDGLAAGVYDVIESVPSGWDLSEIACQDPDGGSSVDLVAAAATIDLDAGETVTCTFVNTAAVTSIRIAKETLPQVAPDSFDFAGDLGGFSLSGGQDVVFEDVAPGIYQVTELAPPAGWNLVSLSCNDPDGGSAGDVGTATATIDLDAGEQIICVFSNRSDGYVAPPPIPVLEGWVLVVFAGLLALAGVLAIRGRAGG